MISSPLEDKNKYDWPKIGNSRLTKYLDNSLVNFTLAQTYIFAGPENLGKSTLALAFARNLLLSDGQTLEGFSTVNSDLHILEREEGKKNISIEAVRGFIKMLSLSSFLNSYKIGIIKEAETLSPEAANALLKTLEEPREKVIIILLASTIELLPATIASRAQILYFYPVASSEIYDYLLTELKVTRSKAKDISALASGRPLLASKFVEHQELYDNHVEAARLFFNFFTQDISKRLQSLNAYTSQSKISSADEVSDLLEIFVVAARDLLLTSLDCTDLIHNMALKTETDNALLSRQQDPAYFLSVLELLGLLKKYVSANVSPTLVLEQLIYNL